MKLGKISESIWKSSVLKYTKQTWNKELGADEKTDCAFSACQEQGVISHVAVASLSLPVAEDILMRHVIYAAVNKLAADGYLSTGITLAITLPERMRQSKLTKMMQEASEICQSLSIVIQGGHTEVSDSVIYPIVSVTAFGTKAPDSVSKISKKALETADLVVTKYIGLEAASLITSRFEAALADRFPKAVVEEAKGYEKYLSILPEAATAMKSGDCILQPIREGGIFAALWNMAIKTGTGLIVDLKKIPVKQNAIEIFNFYDLNPYEILSTGSLLIAAADGEKLVRELEKQGIPATVIGRLQAGNDKVIMNGEEQRFLDKPKPDQIRALLNQEQLKKARLLEADIEKEIEE